MSFLHSSATPVVRSRRTKDGGNRNVVVGIARRREPSKHHEDKSLTPSHQSMEEGCSVDEKEETGITLATSCSPDIGTSIHHSASPADVSSPQPITPLALQQYLDMEPEQQASQSALQNENSPHLNPEDHTERDAQKSKERSKHRIASILTKQESDTNETPVGYNSVRTSGSAKEPSQWDHDDEAPAAAPALVYQYEPSFSPSPVDSPAPSHRTHAYPIDNLEDFNRFEGFEDRSHITTFAEAQPQYPAETSIPFYHPEPIQLPPFFYPIRNQPEALSRDQRPFASPKLVQNTHLNMPYEEDLMSLLHQVNTVLPSLKMYLEQNSAAPIAGNLRKLGKQTLGSWQFEDSQERDRHIKKLNKTITNLHAQFEESSCMLQNKLNDAQSAHSQLEARLNAIKERERSLRSNLEVLNREKEAILSRCRQSETVLESFIQWLLQQTEVRHAAEAPNTETACVAERASHDQTEGTTRSFEDVVPHNDKTFEDDGILGYEKGISHDTPIDISASGTQLFPEGDHSTAIAKGQITSNRSAWLANGWQIAATNARVKLWEEDYARLKRETEERRQSMISQHEDEKHELKVIVSASQARHEAFCEQMQTENTILRREKERMTSKLASQRAVYVQTNLELKDCVHKINKKSQAMQQMLDENLTTVNTEARE